MIRQTTTTYDMAPSVMRTLFEVMELREELHAMATADAAAVAEQRERDAAMHDQGKAGAGLPQRRAYSQAGDY